MKDAPALIEYTALHRHTCLGVGRDSHIDNRHRHTTPQHTVLANWLDEKQIILIELDWKHTNQSLDSGSSAVGSRAGIGQLVEEHHPEGQIKSSFIAKLKC